MKHIYKFFCGRKIFFFFLLLFLNYHALCIGKWEEAFGYFCVFLYGVIVLGWQSTKYLKGKRNEKTNQE